MWLKKGQVGQIYKACESAGSPKLMALHSVIHQQALCGKALSISCVMDPVVFAVKLVRSHDLNHRQFRAFFRRNGITGA